MTNQILKVRLKKKRIKKKSKNSLLLLLKTLPIWKKLIDKIQNLNFKNQITIEAKEYKEKILTIIIKIKNLLYIILIKIGRGINILIITIIIHIKTKKILIYNKKINIIQGKKKEIIIIMMIPHLKNMIDIKKTLIIKKMIGFISKIETKIPKGIKIDMINMMIIKISSNKIKIGIIIKKIMLRKIDPIHKNIKSHFHHKN